MSDTEERTQEGEELETEEKPSTATAASADSADTVAAEGDPPIIVQGGGS